jgi:hypothetical protein
MSHPVSPVLAGWVCASPDPPRGPDAHFIRLATREIHFRSREPLGIFHAEYRLRQEITLAHRHREVLLELRDWFNQNLIAPKLDSPNAIFWFRSDAHRCIRRIWRVVDVLRQNHIVVTMMHTSRPGAIIYRDELQVAAVPFDDHRPIPRMLPTR